MAPFTQALKFFVAAFENIIAVLRNVILTESGVSLWAILLAIIFLSAVLNLFWRGAKG